MQQILYSQIIMFLCELITRLAFFYLGFINN